MKKLGLDLGSSSIGLIVRKDSEILMKSVVTFESGMKKVEGRYSSPTKDRREARSKRNLIRARKYRKWELLKILLEDFCPLDKDELEIWSKYKKSRIQKFPENEKFLKWLKCDFSYLKDGITYNNPYELRVKALEKKLDKHEFGRALYHLVQRRGYKDIGESNQETENQKKKRDESGFQNALDKHKYISKALTKEFLEKNKRARNQYPYRNEYNEELKQICKIQGCEEEFYSKLWKAIIWQRPLRSQKGNIGRCMLEPGNPRCPISHPLFEIFRTWSFINTIKYSDEMDKKQSLPREIKEKLFHELFLKKDKKFKFKDIKKFSDSSKKYNYDDDFSVAGMPICKGLVSLFDRDTIIKAICEMHNFNIGNSSKIVNGYSIYDLWHILFEFDESHLKDFETNKLKFGIDNQKFSKLKKNITSGYSNLSIKAICKIIPFLKEGYTYNEAVLLAKMPELVGSNWINQKDRVEEILIKSNKTYKHNKTISAITNNLIDQYKGLEIPFAYQDYNYQLSENDLVNIKQSCIGFFGKKTWESKTDDNKDEILNSVKNEYQTFFHDKKRPYREVPLLSEIFEQQLSLNNITLDGELYHHSQRDNKYGRTVFDKSGVEILPEARISAIKNPMFNKSMTILRKLVNELIKNQIIDKDTEVVIEVARELNDNNKRIAIERYQRERESKRDKYRELLNEFNEKENREINIDDNIAKVELWTEQIFVEIYGEDGKKMNINQFTLNEKDALKRYKLWKEQNCQCLYTGEMISLKRLFSNEIDIEHTIPRSLLPDNTMANQTVCVSKYNRDVKRNQMPALCNNFEDIKDRLESWIKQRDFWKKRYDEKLKPSGEEDVERKNKRIQEKHYYKMHYDYWHDKVDRFTAEEITDRWVRRQLVDTQMISKYAREFLKTYFKKVSVQKGSITAEFRKIYGFQEADEIKSRAKHTHHAIDAAVLTLIPTNSSHRENILKKAYKYYESTKEQYREKPFEEFNPETMIKDIEKNTLIVNYEEDKIQKETFKNIRKRGRLQYLKNKSGGFILDKKGNKISLKSDGDVIRSTLYKQTYLGKIRDVERDEKGKPIRENGQWKFKQGKEEFSYVERKSIKDVMSRIDDIVDPEIKKILLSQSNNDIVKDYNGKIIRHVRVKTNAGNKVKDRSTFLSKHDYKNQYYSAAGSIPYAILIQRELNGKMVRIKIDVPSFEIAKQIKKRGSFKEKEFLQEAYPEYSNNDFDVKLLKVGQKVIVMNGMQELEKRYDNDFQIKRMYVITQFSEGNIWLKYHLEAQANNEIDDFNKDEKDNLLRRYERDNSIDEVKEDTTIIDPKLRKKDYENRRYRFDRNDSYRFVRLQKKIGIEKLNEIKKELAKFKKQSSKIEIEGKTPLLKMSKENWNFLYEGVDFEISLLGEIKIK